MKIVKQEGNKIMNMNTAQDYSHGDRMMTGPAVERPPSQVQVETTRLKGLNEELGNAIGRLRSRLISVLRQQEQKDQGATPMEVLVPLAGELRGIAEQTEAAIRAITEITNAVELP